MSYENDPCKGKFSAFQVFMIVNVILILMITYVFILLIRSYKSLNDVIGSDNAQDDFKTAKSLIMFSIFLTGVGLVASLIGLIYLLFKTKSYNKERRKLEPKLAHFYLFGLGFILGSSLILSWIAISKLNNLETGDLNIERSLVHLGQIIAINISFLISLIIIVIIINVYKDVLLTERSDTEKSAEKAENAIRDVERLSNYARSKGGKLEYKFSNLENLSEDEIEDLKEEFIDFNKTVFKAKLAEESMRKKKINNELGTLSAERESRYESVFGKVNELETLSKELKTKLEESVKKDK